MFPLIRVPICSEEGNNCCVFHICDRLRIYALVLLLVLHFEFCALLSAPDHLGGLTSPGLGETLETGKCVRLPYFGDDPAWCCTTFGLRAEV